MSKKKNSRKRSGVNTISKILKKNLFNDIQFKDISITYNNLPVNTIAVSNVVASTITAETIKAGAEKMIAEYYNPTIVIHPDDYKIIYGSLENTVQQQKKKLESF